MRPARIEWPTVGVAVAIWGSLALLVVAHDRLPVIVVIAALAMLGAWYGSLQHEVIHGHPTPWRGVNTALVAAPLGLIMPFATYREIHMAHHRSPDLTDPDLDPESFYVSAATWARYGPIRRGGSRALRTLGGRMVLGPFVVAARDWGRLARDARTPAGARRLVAHIAGIAVVWAVVVSFGLSPWVYIVGVAWGGTTLSLLRSFAEHRWTEDGTRSAVVRAGPAMALLYLNNNLHHTHHARPAEPWFRLPAVHRELDGDGAAAAGAGLYRGYADVARRHLWRPFDQPVLTTAPPVATPS